MTVYSVKLTLLRTQLGTVPIDPNVMDTHIIDKQRKLLLNDSKVNKEINKYLDALDISDERKEKELNLVIAKLEQIMGTTFSDKQRENLLGGTLEDLKETFADFDSKGLTVFFKDEATGRPMIGDHMIYGFLKAAAEAISRTKPRKNGTIFGSTSYTQSIINQHVRCSQEFLVFDKDLIKDEAGNPVYLQRSLRAMTMQGPRISLAKSEQVPAGASLEFDLNVLDDSPLTEAHLRELFGYGIMTGLGQWRNSGKGAFSFTMMQQ